MLSSVVHSHLIVSDQHFAMEQQQQQQQQQEQQEQQQQPRRLRSCSVISNDDYDDDDDDDINDENDSCSGYSADEEEETSVHWELSFDTDSKRRLDQECDNGRRAKRCKLEINFASSTIAADLANACLPYPDTMSSQITPDLSNVRLISSTHMQPSSPSATAGCCNPEKRQYDLQSPDLLAQSAPAYQLSVPMPLTVALPYDWRSVGAAKTSSIIGTGRFVASQPFLPQVIA